jgi:hypothetical protein
MKRKLLAILITAIFAAPAAYAQGTTAPKDSGAAKAPAATGSASTSTKAGASVNADTKAGNAGVSASAKADGKAKNGKSPDAMITGKIKTGFIKDKIVRSRNYNVDTRDGVVTVKGKARSQAELDRALEIAKKTEGVKDVKNEVQVMASADKSGSAKAGADAKSSSAAGASTPKGDTKAGAAANTKGSASTTTK